MTAVERLDRRSASARGRERQPPQARQLLRSHEEVLRELGIKKFSTEYRRLSRIVGADDFASREAAQALTRALLGMFVGAMPRIEENLNKYGARQSMRPWPPSTA